MQKFINEKRKTKNETASMNFEYFSFYARHSSMLIHIYMQLCISMCLGMLFIGSPNYKCLAMCVCVLKNEFCKDLKMHTS